LRHRQAKLTASRLCTETPTAGGRVFETGDERLLQLAHQTESAFLTTTLVMYLSLGMMGSYSRNQLLSWLSSQSMTDY